MREKMREHLAPAASKPPRAGMVPVVREAEDEEGSAAEAGLDILGKFDLKHDTGAIVDIEFLVQYLVLANAGACPQLTRWTDVVRLLDELGAAGILSTEETATLHLAYLTFRSAVHENWLGIETDFTRLHQLRQDVYAIWSEKMHPTTTPPAL